MIFYLIATVLFNIFFIIFHKKIAKLVNVFDYPDNKRKLHKSITPITGGLIIFFNLLIYSFFILLNDQFNQEIKYLFLNSSDFILFIVTSIFIFILGIVDDKISISPNKKFLLVLFLILPSIFYSDMLIIENVRVTFLNNSFHIGSLSFFWTLLCFLLFINAFNMFDGINLQVSIYSKILCLGLIMMGGYENLIISLFIGLLTFTILNKRSQSFLGDGGTYLLAYIFGYCYIKLYNFNSDIYADQIVLIMILPGIELMRLFITRIIKKKNPFSADRNHLHHYLSKKFNLFNSTIITQSMIIFPFILSLLFGYTFYFLILVLVIYTFLIIKLAQ